MCTRKDVHIWKTETGTLASVPDQLAWCESKIALTVNLEATKLLEKDIKAWPMLQLSGEYFMNADNKNTIWQAGFHQTKKLLHGKGNHRAQGGRSVPWMVPLTESQYPKHIGSSENSKTTLQIMLQIDASKMKKKIKRKNKRKENLSSL